MTAKLFTLPKQVPVSNVGVSVPGAKAYFYVQGTSTPQDTYTTSALNIAHPNPVVADGFGIFPVIYIDVSLRYKLKITDANDIEIYTEDDFQGQSLSDDLFPQTAAELAAAVTPTDFSYPQGNVLRYGAAGDGVTNDTAAVQAAIDLMSTQSLGPLKFPAGTYLGNWIIKDDVVIQGDGPGVTYFIPAIDDAVFKTPLDVSTNRIGFEDFRIVGNPASNANTGIQLKTTTASTFVDNIEMKNLFIEQCGLYGIHAYGESAAGPFVQRLKIKDCFVFDNANHGLFMEGHTFECSAENSFFVTNGGSLGGIANVFLDTNKRMYFRNCGFNHADAITAGNPDTAVEVVTGNQVKFDCCDFEQADPMLEIRASCKGITVETCNFSSANAATSFILLTSVDGCYIRNNQFSATGVVTNYIRQTTAVSNVSRLTIAADNFFATGGTLTKAVEVLADVTIASGAINKYRDIQYVDTEAAAASDNLDNIYDTAGGVLTLIDGETITLGTVNASHVVVVKHNTGNIQLDSGADFTMNSTRQTLTLVWQERWQLWREVSRAA